MLNPFLSFDPFFWFFDFLILFPLLFLFFPYFLKNNIIICFLEKIKKEIKILFPLLGFYFFGVWRVLFFIFYFFLLINIFSLFRFIFSPTAHILFSFSFGLLIWLRTFFIQIFFFIKRKIIHFSPQGTPIWLLPLMVLIELIRQLIRPITLRVRLAANLTAGHLILSLISSLSLIYRGLIQLPLIFLEILVSFVQPFVFCILLFLYFSEN